MGGGGETMRARLFSLPPSQQAEFEEALNGIAEEVSGLQRFTRLDNVGTAAPLVARLKSSIDDAERKSRLFNTREGLFGRDLTSYERLGDIKKTFEPFSVLWETTGHWIKSQSKPPPPCDPRRPFTHFTTVPVSSLLLQLRGSPTPSHRCRQKRSRRTLRRRPETWLAA